MRNYLMYTMGESSNCVFIHLQKKNGMGLNLLQILLFHGQVSGYFFMNYGSLKGNGLEGDIMNTLIRSHKS